MDASLREKLLKGDLRVSLAECGEDERVAILRNSVKECGYELSHLSGFESLDDILKRWDFHLFTETVNSDEVKKLGEGVTLKTHVHQLFMSEEKEGSIGYSGISLNLVRYHNSVPQTRKVTRLYLTRKGEFLLWEAEWAGSMIVAPDAKDYPEHNRLISTATRYDVFVATDEHLRSILTANALYLCIKSLKMLVDDTMREQESRLAATRKLSAKVNYLDRVVSH